MNLNRNRFRLGAWLVACVASVALVSAALAQPPKPGGARRRSTRRWPGPGPGPGGGALAAVVLAVAVRVAGPGGAAPSPTFAMRVCNKTNDIDIMYVAIVTVVGQQFRAQGWTQVPRGQCGNIGTFTPPQHLVACQGLERGQLAEQERARGTVRQPQRRV